MVVLSRIHVRLLKGFDQRIGRCLRAETRGPLAPCTCHSRVIVCLGSPLTPHSGIAAWCFFFGTIMYWNNPSVGPFFYTENYIAIWMLGSLLFALGGCFLAYRHLNGM